MASTNLGGRFAFFCRYHRRLRLESLEDRRLLSADAASQEIEVFSMQDALFAENAGQWPDEEVYYGYNQDGTEIYFTPTGLRFGLSRSEPLVTALTEEEAAQVAMEESFGSPFDIPSMGPDMLDDEVVVSTRFSLSFDGAQPTIPVGEDEAITYFNYHLGGDASRWVDGVDTFKTVVYEGLYDGIDLKTFSRSGQMKYEFHVIPGGDCSQIEMSYSGIEGLYLDETGSLHIETELGEIVDENLYVYQVVDGQEIEIAAEFRLLDEDSYTFEITGAYNPTLELVIDPEVSWVTCVGGSNYDYGRDLAVDAADNALIAGMTYSSGWASGEYSGSWDAFVAKLTPDGVLTWATYLGGIYYEYSNGIAVDATGNVLVIGQTESPDWASGIFGGCVDAFVAKLTPDGGLTWATYLGGSSGVDQGIAVDADGNALVTGDTDSPFFGWSSGEFGGLKNVFVAKLTPEGDFTWVTYLGGNGYDFGRGIAVDTVGNVLITGETSFSDWASEEFGSGDYNAFVAKLTPGGDLTWVTYLGGSNSDGGLAIAVDAIGNALVTGETKSSDWASGEYGGNGDAFVAKLTPGGSLTWATYLGGDEFDSCWGIAVDVVGKALVTGYTYSSGWASGGFGGVYDAFAAKLTPGGTLTWAIYLGGSNKDNASGIAVDTAGNVLVTGNTSSSDWVPGGFGGLYDAFVAKISDPYKTHILGRYLCYPAYEGSDGTIDSIIAFDKQALLPEQTATRENYSNCSDGISAILLDLDMVTGGVELTATDFEFRIGNSDDPTGWQLAPSPEMVLTFPGEGVDESTRIALVWSSGTIQNTWLQVIIKANENTGLVANDVFYFGSFVGDVGDSSSPGMVTAADLIAIRNHPHGPGNPAGIDNRYDINKDTLVNATDLILARNHIGSPLEALRMIAPTIDPGPAPAPGENLSGEPRMPLDALDLDEPLTKRFADADPLLIDLLLGEST